MPRLSFVARVLVGCVVSFVSTAGFADDTIATLAKARELLAAGDYAAAKPMLERLAETSTDAMLDLGSLHEDGRGVTKDDAQAIRWYRRAAEAGAPRAMAKVARMYVLGRGGLSRDATEAERWYRKAAEAGDIPSMTYLAELLISGPGGLKTDAHEARAWLDKAVKGGDGRAMTVVGRVYEQGAFGVPKDLAKALVWYRRGAAAGSGYAKAALGLLHDQGVAGLAADEAEALRLFREGAEAGDGDAMGLLGRYHDRGAASLRPDVHEARRWYHAGTVAGSAFAMFWLADALESGTTKLPPDEGQALHWYRAAAWFGFPDATERAERIQGKGKDGRPVFAIKVDPRAVDFGAWRVGAAARRRHPAAKMIEDNLYFRGVEQWGAGKLPEAFETIRTLLAVNPVSLDGHRVSAAMYSDVVRRIATAPDLPQEGKAHAELFVQRHKAFAEGLAGSILATGDGQSPRTAYRVLSVIEEYALMAYLGYPKVRMQALVAHEAKDYDMFVAEDRAGASRTFYFDISAFFHRH